MSQSELFETLGAPLNNVRWSWGGVRGLDGAVFLRVWQDGTIKVNGKRYIWVSVENPPGDDLGENERMDHLKLVQSGQPCYLVMCQAVDTSAAPRTIQSFNRSEVFETGEVILKDGDYWIEITGRVKVCDVARVQQGAYFFGKSS